MPAAPPLVVPVAPTPVGQGARTTPDLGPGFPVVPAEPPPLVRELHDFLAGKTPGLFNAGLGLALSRISSVTERSLGVNAGALLDVERTMYRMMVPSRDGYIGGSPPIFQALASGQAAYVYLHDDAHGADHLTRLFSGLPPETLATLGPGNDKYTPVRKALLERMQRGDFPAYVDVDGNYAEANGTESIATESLASIARKENALGQGSADPSTYYRWLVTRADSAWRRSDPWLYDARPALHNAIEKVKDDLTPPWVEKPSSDPFGSVPFHARVQDAYARVLGQAGGGRPPTVADLADFADTAISLDRDLLFAVQTYWSKLVGEIAPAQRESLFAPLAKSWVSLNVLPPSDPDFERVSPSTAPYIELVDQNSGNRKVLERYDRAMALSEVVSHTLAGLGIEQRKSFMSAVLAEVSARKDAIVEREARVRAILGGAYSGLDVEGIVSGRVDASDARVRAALDQLQRAASSGGSMRPMTPEHAEIQRHLSILGFLAERVPALRESAVELAQRLPQQTHDPLIVGQYYDDDPSAAPTPLPTGPSGIDRWGSPKSATEMPASVVFEGGGGKGLAYIECLKQLKDGIRSGGTSLAVDQFVGTSAGAITAGLLAAGFNEHELADVMQQLDIKKFYADYLWLAGGVDAQVRGFDRTGLFSTRQMYRTLDTLLRRKTHVEGRPVLFRDLPFKLTVVATVVNTDLPEDLRQQLGIGKDGQIVFSSETTPNMDVAAAITGSAAVPAFFNAPQMLVVRDEPDGQGGTVKREYRIQLVDGGTVNNFPIAAAAKPDEAKPSLVVCPAYYQAPGPRPGDPPVTLSTLDFDASHLPAIDAYNRQRYAAFAPKLGGLIEGAQRDGCGRAVIGFKLVTPEEQPSLIVQGTSRDASEHLRGIATQVGIETMTAKDAADAIRQVYPKETPRVEEKVLDEVLDSHDTIDTSLCHPPVYHIGSAEASGLSDVLASVTAAQLVAPYEVRQKLFEH